jgi:hypothetical protein
VSELSGKECVSQLKWQYRHYKTPIKIKQRKKEMFEKFGTSKWKEIVVLIDKYGWRNFYDLSLLK